MGCDGLHGKPDGLKKIHLCNAMDEQDKKNDRIIYAKAIGWVAMGCDGL